MVFETLLEMPINLPKKNNHADTAWFAFPFFIKENAPFSRRELMIFFEKHNK